jgi:hypothetical protein
MFTLLALTSPQQQQQQQQQQQPTYLESLEVRLTSLDVMVSDKSGERSTSPR